MFEIVSQEGSYIRMLSVLMATLRSNVTRLNYAQIQRSSGLASRAYVRQILLGQKEPRPDTLRKLLLALKVPEKVIKLLELQLRLEQSSSPKEKRELEKKLALAKRVSSVVKNQELASKAYASFATPWIYAALGSPQQGASMEQIQKRTRLDKELIENGLALLVEQGVASLGPKGKYLPRDQMLVFEKHGAASFKSFFLKSADRSLQKARVGFVDPNFLFSSQVVSVKQEQLPHIQERLWGLLKDFIADIEEAEGDTVINIVSMLND